MIPPEANADFVCAMEDVLEVYQRPYDPKHPMVCVDEATKQLFKETRRVSYQPHRDAPNGTTTNTSATGRPICS